MDFRFIVFVLLIQIIGALGKMGRILGGEVTEIRQMPYLVSIKSVEKLMHDCGGSIISHRHVLTAAHCIALYGNPVYELIVYSGTTYYTGQGGWLHRLSKVDIHPQYTGTMTKASFLRYDIAILTLAEALVFNEYQNMIDLPVSDINQGDSITIAGWGAVAYPDNIFPSYIQQITGTVIKKSECSQILGRRINKEQLCTLQPRGVGLCSGDSGNPLVSNGRIIGVASFVIPCALGVPDVHGNVYHSLPFIMSVIR